MPQWSWVSNPPSTVEDGVGPTLGATRADAAGAAAMRAAIRLGRTPVAMAIVTIATMHAASSIHIAAGRTPRRGEAGSGSVRDARPSTEWLVVITGVQGGMTTGGE